jgi:hypothetical protein
MVATIAIKRQVLGLALAILAGPALAGVPESGPAPAGRPHLMVPGCAEALPLDAGQAFAGPRFLISGDRITFFEAVPPGPGSLPGQAWRLAGGERLPAVPPAAGLDRARVKWRDGALWMKAGSRVYQRDAATGQWFVMADPALDFRDFEVDLKGRILLVATADPRTRRYRALLEAVGPDRRSTEILCGYPDPDYPRWFDRISPVAAATLLTGYESVQVQEFIVLCNPLARRVFIYRALDGKLREADLGLPARSIADLAPRPGEEPAAPGDLCWQVLPKDNAEAWIVYPDLTGPGVDRAAGDSGGGPGGTLNAMVLDLEEGRGGPPVPLKGRHLPLLFDPQGRLAELPEALGRFEQAARAARP